MHFCGCLKKINQSIAHNIEYKLNDMKKIRFSL